MCIISSLFNIFYTNFMDTFIFGCDTETVIPLDVDAPVNIQLIISAFDAKPRRRRHSIKVVAANEFDCTISKYMGEIKSESDSQAIIAKAIESAILSVDSAFGKSNLNAKIIDFPNYRMICSCSTRSSKLEILEHIGELEHRKWFSSFIAFTLYIHYRKQLQESIVLQPTDVADKLANGERQLEIIEDLENDMFRPHLKLFDVRVSSKQIEFRTGTNALIVTEHQGEPSYTTKDVLDVTSNPDDVKKFGQLLPDVQTDDYRSNTMRYFKMRKNLDKFVVDEKLTLSDDQQYSHEQIRINEIIEDLTTDKQTVQLSGDRVITVQKSNKSTGFANCLVVNMDNNIKEYSERISHKNLVTRLEVILKSIKL